MDWEQIQEIDEEALKKESEELLELRYLTKETAVFTKTAGGFVALDFQGKHYDRVFVYRTFPNSQPESYLSIREADEKAKEIGMVEDLSVLETAQAEMLREQLALRYFTPKILKIYEVKEEYGYAYFETETTYGRCRFTIQMGGGTVIPLGDNKYQISDLDGNRYIIEDVTKLSAKEQKKMDLFL